MAEHKMSKAEERCVRRLREGLATGAIPLELARRFLDDPESVVGDLDELRIAWLIAEQEEPQSCIAVLWYIAQTSRDPEALAAARSNWQAASSFPPGTKEGVAELTTRLLLAFGYPDEALEVARSVSSEWSKARMLLEIFKQTSRDELLQEVVQTVPAEDAVAWAGVMVAMARLLKTHQAIEQAQTALHACSANPFEDHPWLCTSYTKALVFGNEVGEARVAAERITHPDARRVSLANIIAGSKERRDCLALVQQGPAERSARTNISCINAILGTGHIDLARRFAQAASHPGQQCMLYSRVSCDRLGTSDDFLNAEVAYRSLRGGVKMLWFDSPYLYFAYALTHAGQLRGARKVAARIPAGRIRAKAFLGIYANKGRADFTDQFVEDED